MKGKIFKGAYMPLPKEKTHTKSQIMKMLTENMENRTKMAEEQ